MTADADLGPTTNRAAHRRGRALLLGLHVVAVAVTLPEVAAGHPLHVPQVALWFVAMVALTGASLSARLDRLFTRAGPTVTLGLVLWIVLLTGGSASPYLGLYIPVVAFMAVFRETPAFVGSIVLAIIALGAPAAAQGEAAVLVADVVVGAVIAAALVGVHLAAAGYRDTSSLYRSVVEHHGGPTYVIAADGRVSWANQPMLDLLGVELDGVVGVPWQEFVADGEVEQLTHEFAAALQGEPRQLTIELDGPGGRYQLRGTIFPMSRRGRVAGVMGITEDVTELQEAAFGADTLRQTLDALAFPVAIFDTETHRLLYANAVAWWLTGAARRPSRQLRWEDLHDDLRRVSPAPGAPRTVSVRAEHGPQPDELDVTVQCLDSRRPVLVLSGLDASDRGRRERSLMELVEAEHAAAERLRTLDRMKNAFVTAVSHELRTPVTVIVGGAKSLVRLRDAGAPAGARAALEDAMVRQADALAALLADLLDVDRLTRGVLQPEADRFDVVEVVHRQADHLPEGHPVAIDAPERLEVNADPGQVERIVSNLLHNAAKYAPATDLTVVVRPLDVGGFRLEVIDGGSGIAPEDLARVFEPFYRADLDHPQPGMGVGLALVAEFAEINGGRAWAEQADGGGTRVVVEIPDRAGQLAP